MRGRVVAIAGAVLVLGAAALAWRARPVPPPPPVKQAPKPPAVGMAPDAAGAIAIAAPPNGAPALNTDVDVKEPTGFEAGATLEVTLELFDEKGHVAGATIVLKNPPCPPDGGTGTGAVEVEARTNVMGFARIALVPGTWEIENFQSSPARIEVGWGTNAYVLKKSERAPGTVEGSVLDLEGKPVPNAEVSLAGARLLPPRPHEPPRLTAPVFTDAQGHFAFRTHEPKVLLTAKEGGRAAEPLAATAGTKDLVLQLR